MTGLPQTIPTVTVGASYGSAFLAAGLVAEVDVRDWNPPAVRIEPDPHATAAYEPGYRDYRELYETTKAVVHRLAARS